MAASDPSLHCGRAVSHDGGALWPEPNGQLATVEASNVVDRGRQMD